MFKSNGRSVAHNENVGEIRVIRNKADNKIVGVTMVGAAVTELVAAARALIGSKEKITDVSFAHPTVSEVLKEAWEDAIPILEEFDRLGLTERSGDFRMKGKKFESEEFIL